MVEAEAPDANNSSDDHACLPHEAISENTKSEPQTKINTTCITEHQDTRDNTNVACPQCGSKRPYNDGFRYLSDGTSFQRMRCRVCCYRFSENRSKLPLQKTSKQSINTASAIQANRQICAILEEAKNLTTATEIKTVAGASPEKEQDIKGLIVEYLWHLQKEGRKPLTILARRKALSRLHKHGANLLDPESVKETIMQEKVSINTKNHYVTAYDGLAKWLNISWKPPQYKFERKLPWLPNETELDQLIAGYKKKTATFLQTLKETMARAGEAWQLEWTDLNGNILTINAPEKGSNPRQFKISDKLVSMLNNLPKKSKRVFGPTISLSNFRTNFAKRRKRIAQTLGNPRINKITFHTFRHWGATMLFHKTKNILYVKQQLGHKCIENTMVYTQLINFESDEWHVAHAKTLEEEDKLIQAGFDFVRYDEKEQLAIYRKRK